MGIITVGGIKVPIGSHIGKEIVIGSDHRGFSHKGKIIEHLHKKGYEVIDVGTDTPQRCDYPIISNRIARRVSEDLYKRVGIGICGSGIGILIPASKHPFIYVARCLHPEEAFTSRVHNNTNMIGIGADFLDVDSAIETIDAWLIAEFYSDPEKHEPYLNRYLQTVRLEETALS